MSNRQLIRILIIEDEPMIALVLKELLIARGFQVAGVTAKLAKALAMIELGALEAAIVDANLGGVSASPAGAALEAKGLPYLVLSGYSAEQQPGAFPGAALFMQKPFVPDLLIEALSGIVFRP
ncbi:MAG: response regulator [Rhodomicrobium sp.]